MNVLEVMERLTAAAATATSTPVERTMTAYEYVPENVQAPCCYPTLSSPIEYDLTMGHGMSQMTVGLVVLCPRADAREGQRMLYGYMAGAGPTSVKAAIEAQRGAPGAPALNGACDDLQVKRVSDPRWYDHGGEKYLGAEWTIFVIGDGA